MSQALRRTILQGSADRKFGQCRNMIGFYSRRFRLRLEMSLHHFHGGRSFMAPLRRTLLSGADITLMPNKPAKKTNTFARRA